MKSYVFEVIWLKGDANGYRDLLPLKLFDRATTGAECVHEVRGPGNGVYRAKARLTVVGRTGRLDYSRYREFNLRNVMQLGVMTLEFQNETRRRVSRVLWNGTDVTSEWARVRIRRMDQSRSGTDALAKRERRLAQQVARPQQVAFRRDLGLAYGERCPISDCPVEWALEAAHLIPVAKGGSDSPSNGLLLRADLHKLLDAGCLAINPKTSRVALATGVRKVRDYAKLHGRKLRQPSAGYLHWRPRKDGLTERWRVFVK